jgi:dimethylglycine dehydrogenase
MIETGTFSKYEVSGAGARAWLDRLLACKVPRTGRMCLAPMLSPTGRLMGDLTLMALGEQRFWLVGSGQLQGFHMRWFEQQLGNSKDVRIRNVTDEQAGFAISGPRSRELLAAAVGDAALVAPGALRFMDVKEMDVGLARAVVARVSVTGELGYEVTAPAAQMRQLYAALHSAGENLGLRNIGSYALTCARLEKGFGAWGREYTPEFTPRMSGLQRFIALDKKCDFVGKAAVAAEVANPRKPAEWQLSTITVHGGPAQTSDAWGYEPLWVLEAGKEPRYCGFTTSGAYGHHVKQSIALAYIDTQAVDAISQRRAKLQLWLLGEPVEARLSTTSALYDESGSKMMS